MDGPVAFDGSGATHPAWGAPLSRGAPRRLRRRARADVCVIGAGAAGLCAAYVLARAGKSVVVLDQGGPGSGETARTTAHLTVALDRSWAELERLHGRETARLAAESHAAAIKRIGSIARRERLACGFEELDGYSLAAPGRDALDEELEACANVGLLAVERLRRAPDAPWDTGPCLRFPRQGQLDPARWLDGLGAAVERLGGRIFRARATSVEGGRRARVGTEDGPAVECAAVVVATNAPFNDRAILHLKQWPRRTYVISLSASPGFLPRALFWDRDDPYHYVRRYAPPGEPEQLIVGGEDHGTGEADDAEARWVRLERWTRERFPAAEAVTARWSGQVVEPVDGLAFIGRNPLDDDNVYVATGHSGNGITYGMIAGLLLGDLIMGRPNRWEGVYSPGRLAPGAAAPYARRLAAATAHYSDWLTRGPFPEVEAREGRRVCRLSAVCPHAGGVVRRNSGERSWDCPVHGSRFALDGRALNGPAPSDLRRLGGARARRSS